MSSGAGKDEKPSTHATPASLGAETDGGAAPAETPFAGRPFELDDDDVTQTQAPSDIAGSQLRSKGPCQAPGYRILQPLGAGTYGEVWLAEEERTGVRVAIKFFAHGAGQEWQLLQAEVRQLAQLHADPGIVQLIDVEIDSKPPYYIMAYAKQGSLAQRLDKGPLPLAEAMEIFRRVAEALAYVHAKGIRHCDLKPGNVLLDARGRALVADFGQAHLSCDASPALGTFFYMAPEQADLTNQLPDTRWDVYGLGALMYAMLTGRPPREDATLRTELAGTAELSHRLRRYREAIQKAPRPTDHRQVSGIDRGLIDIIDRCLEINPDARLRDAGAVLTALERRERKRRQRPAFIFGMVAPMLLLLVMAGLVTWVFGTAKENTQEAQRTLGKKVSERNQFIAELVADDVEERLAHYIRLVESAARNPDVRQATKKPEPAKLAVLLKKSRAAADKDKMPEFVWVADRAGIILKIEPDVRLPAIGFQWRDWFNGHGDMDKEARADPIGKTYISQPYLSTAEGEPMLIAISAPIHDPDDPKEIIGVLAASLRFEDLEKWVARLDLGHDFAVILNERGQYLSHQARADIKPKHGGRPRTAPNELREQLLLAPEPGILRNPFSDPINDRTYHASYAPLKNRDIGWVVLIQQEEAAAAKPIEELNRSMLTIGLIAVAMMGILIPALWGWLIWMLRREEGIGHG